MIKIKVITHSEQEDVLEVQEYNPQQLVQEINDQSENRHTICIGDVIYSKIDIKHISKVIE